MGLIDSARLNNLKARVKSECQRRNRTGSVASYAGESYDYTVVPSEDSIILQEHYEKLAVPLNAINKTIQVDISGDRIISDAELDAMESMLTTLEARKYYDSSATDCSASCTGMCYSCSGTCSGGCSGNCSGGCSGCGDTCSHSCNYDCYGSCEVTCGNDGCVGQCVVSCFGDCRGGCISDCTGNCGELCSTGCSSNCAFCSGTCSGVAQFN